MIWKKNPSIRTRLLGILITNKWINQALSARQISETSGIKLNTVQKYLLGLWKDGLAKRVKSVRGYFMYLASEHIERWTNLVEVPSTSLETFLDIGSMKWEDRKAKARLRSDVSELLRAGCSEASKKDRAAWRSHSGRGFSIAISKKGVVVVRVSDTEEWKGSFRNWCTSLGVGVLDVEQVLSDLEKSIPEGFGRLEVPITAPGLKEGKVKLEVETIFDGDRVLSNINYSGNIVGWEMSGPNKFLDIVASELATFQHKLAVQYMASRMKDKNKPTYFG